MLPLNVRGSSNGIRTHTGRILSPLSLPVGLRSHKRRIGDRAPPLIIWPRPPFKHNCSYATFAGYSLGISTKNLYLINNQLLLFPALLRVWYCLEGHDSLLAVCCMPQPTAGAGSLPVIGYTDGSFLYPYKLIRSVSPFYLDLTYERKL